MAGFWTRVYYRVSDRSTMFFWILLITNASAILTSIVVFLLCGSIKIVDQNENELEPTDPCYQEIKRGMAFMALLIVLLSLSQSYIGVHSVGWPHLDPQEKPLRLVWLLHDGHAAEFAHDRLLGVRGGPFDQIDQVLLWWREAARHDFRCSLW